MTMCHQCNERYRGTALDRVLQISMIGAALLLLFVGSENRFAPAADLAVDLIIIGVAISLTGKWLARWRSGRRAKREAESRTGRRDDLPPSFS